ncbi:hypothetical protein SDC9_121296 [bioreactor metagenome]|uniref:Uncharacterized protein n=1 Tax=bioreactor metagenome TaxID=1076179 RepID=A0A645CBK7_9ZZZZ
MAGGLEHPFSRKLEAHADGAAANDAKILGAVSRDLRVFRKVGKEEAGAEKAEEKEDKKADEVDKVSVECDGVRVLIAALAQTAGEDGVYAHAGAHADGDHKGLDRKGVGKGEKGFFVDLGHKDGIDQVIESLDEHGEHHGPGHLDEQTLDGHGTHLVGFGLFQVKLPLCVYALSQWPQRGKRVKSLRFPRLIPLFASQTPADLFKRLRSPQPARQAAPEPSSGCPAWHLPA